MVGLHVLEGLGSFWLLGPELCFGGEVVLLEVGMFLLEGAQDGEQPRQICVCVALDTQSFSSSPEDLVDLAEDLLLQWWIWTRTKSHVLVIGSVVLTAANTLEVLIGVAGGLLAGNEEPVQLHGVVVFFLVRDEHLGFVLGDD